ncbi:MAG: hypothetical protein NVS3B21_27610 [Acidimicrobiales bacterium]
MFKRRTVDVRDEAQGLGGCESHPFERATSTCRACRPPFCTDCVVFSFGPHKPPFCVSCALAAAGIRRPTQRSFA